MSTTDDRAELLALDAFDEGGSWDAPSHVRFLRAQGDGSSGFTADLIEKLYQALRTRAATALTGARAEIERLTADRNQMMKQVAELGRQLAAETERCARVADNAFGGKAHNGRSGGMSDNIVNLGDIRAGRSAYGRDWTPLELLRKLVKDIEDGVRTPDRIYVAMTEKLDDDSTYYPYFSAGMNSIECVGLLAQHLHFRSML